MRASWRPALFAGIAAGMLLSGFLQRSAAQTPAGTAGISDGVVKLGLILDLSGPYSEVSGIGSATAARMAVADFGGRVLGAPIEVMIADHENNSGRALAIARDWIDNQHLDAIMDVSGSSEAVLVQRFADVRHKLVSISSAAAIRLSNESCTPTSIHYVSNTRAVARAVGGALLARGADTWFFITVDYGFGYDLENDTTEVIEARGGKVLGRARHPLTARDFGSYLARAQESKAKVIALANAGSNLEDTIRQAARLGMIPGPQLFAAPSLRITGVNSLGLEITQGMALAESFYWDADAATRAWAKRFFDLVKRMPNSLHAGVYSSTMHYLNAVKQTGTDATDAVLKAMRDTPVNDFFAHDARIRADGVLVHDLHLFQVKSPAESRYPWDYLRPLATVPGTEAFGSPAESKCPLMQR
jgi:branched-chain amino acid transport system substrate-binding protein